MTAQENITWHAASVSPEDRERLLGQKGCVLWFTGLSGSGKSTIAVALEEALVKRGNLAYVLDGDNVRHGLNADLTFSPTDRTENIRRVSEVAALFADAGIIVITAFISPYRSDREEARRKMPADRFIEVFVDTPLDVCESRDPKRLYAKARAGEISDFTGIGAPYEVPRAPEIELLTHKKGIPECIEQIIAELHTAGILKDNATT